MKLILECNHRNVRIRLNKGNNRKYSTWDIATKLTKKPSELGSSFFGSLKMLDGMPVVLLKSKFIQTYVYNFVLFR